MEYRITCLSCTGEFRELERFPSSVSLELVKDTCKKYSNTGRSMVNWELIEEFPNHRKAEMPITRESRKMGVEGKLPVFKIEIPVWLYQHWDLYKSSRSGIDLEKFDANNLLTFRGVHPI